MTDDTFKKLSSCAPLKKRIKTLKELGARVCLRCGRLSASRRERATGIDYLAYESRVIHFDRPLATVALFGEKSTSRASEMVRASRLCCADQTPPTPPARPPPPNATIASR